LPLIDPLPPALEKALEANGSSNGNLAIAISTDLNPDGTFGEEWLVVTRDRMMVYEPDSGHPRPRLEISLADIRSPHTDLLVGGAALEATVDGRAIELVRYSNARMGQFRKVARYLGEVAKYNEAVEKGEDLPDEPTIDETVEESKRCPTCNLPLGEGKVCPACLNKRKVMLRLLGYLAPYWKQTVTVWALMIFGTVLGLITPYLNKPLFDQVLAPRHPASTAHRLDLLGWLVLALLGTQVLGQIVGISRGRLMAWLGASLSHDLRTKLYQHLQLLSLGFFDKRQTGAIMTRVSQDTQSLNDVLTNGAQFLVVNTLSLVGITGVMLAMNWRLTLMILVPAPLVVYLSHRFWRRIRTLYRRNWHYRQLLSASLNDSLSGVRVVKAFAQEQQEINRFQARSFDFFQAGWDTQRTTTTFFPILGFVMGTGTLIVWYFGGRQVVGRSMTLGTLTMFMSYLGMFYGPMQFMTQITDWISRSLTSAERVFEILDQEPDVEDAEDAVPMPDIVGHVQFDHVTFGYDVHKPVLNDVSLDVQPGEMIGFVGHSGAGKSTTINLICRFYDPQQGALLIDGVPAPRISQQDLRSQIGVVLQDTFLFNGTIAENISYARPGSTLEEIMAAAKAANAHDFIVSKADGYDTQVGERGQSLSGGERQRISIARAILHNPRILILDEATSSVDTDTEKQIQDAIARLVKGRTTFAIAHRLSTLRNADRLVVLKGGKIEEVGTHDELIEKKGEFFRLVEMQQEMSRIKAVAR